MDRFEKGFVIFAVISIGIGVWLIGSLCFLGDDVIVESKVTDVEIVSDNVLLITFANGESYKVFSSTDRDFTVNSKLIVKLYKDDLYGLSESDTWTIDYIIKAPEGGSP